MGERALLAMWLGCEEVPQPVEKPVESRGSRCWRGGTGAPSVEIICEPGHKTGAEACSTWSVLGFEVEANVPRGTIARRQAPGNQLIQHCSTWNNPVA